MMNQTLRIFLLFLAVSAGGCSESLPLYQEPAQFYSASLSYTVTRAPRPPSVSEYQWAFVVSYKNTYDEALSDSADLRGILRIQWKQTETALPTPSNSITLPFGRENIDHVSDYKPSTGILTINPGDSLVLKIPWNFYTEDSTNLYKKFVYETDSCMAVYDVKYAQPENGDTVYRRMISRKQHFTLQGELNVFRKTARTYLPAVEIYDCVILPYLSTLRGCDALPGSPCK